jgi:hypothetical protein
VLPIFLSLDSGPKTARYSAKESGSITQRTLSVVAVVVPAAGARLVQAIVVVFEELVPLGVIVLVTGDETKLKHQYITELKNLNMVRHTWRTK